MRFAPGRRPPARSISFHARLLAALSIGVVLGGCGVIPHYVDDDRADANVQSVQQADVQPAVGQGAGDGHIEQIPFRVGVSSATVEKMAKAQACTGGPGAGLITTPGPVEVYRMHCDGGKVFMARCELHQCKPM
jgi:hypothetical protein